MQDTVHGTCGVCGGRVITPGAWMSTKPPVPTCENCGTRQKQDHGPVLNMEPAKDTKRG